MFCLLIIYNYFLNLFDLILAERRDPLQALVKNGGSKRNALLIFSQDRYRVLLAVTDDYVFSHKYVVEN